MDTLRWYKVALVLTLLIIVGGTWHAEGSEKRVTVGNKNFTEQYVIGQMIKQLLEDRGFKVDLRADLTSMALRSGMESGDIDICADYTGTAWMVYLKRKYEPGVSHIALHEAVKEKDMENGLMWLSPIWNNNTYAFSSWLEFAGKHRLKTLSDLARYYRHKDGKVETFVNFEFSARPDGLPALQMFYDFKIAKPSLKTGTPGASLIALKTNQTQVAMVFGTDASIAKYAWQIYLDDKSFFPPYDLTPCVRKEILSTHPEIGYILNELVATFPGSGKEATPHMISECRNIWQDLNAKVDIDKMEPTEVAHEYLRRHGLIKNGKPQAS
jgi:osmoprotectant transport system substrate-binding protein